MPAAAVDRPLRVGPRTRAWLIAVVVLVGLGTLVAGAWLWPRGPLPQTAGAGYGREDTVSATVLTVQRRTCAGTSDDRLADGSVAATVSCAAVRVRLAAGPDAGRVVPVEVTGPTVDEGLAPGDRAVVARFPDAVGGANEVYAWVDFERGQPMWLLAAVFVIVVLVVARLRGLAAIVGVGAGFTMILVFLLPALRRGENPVAVTLVGCIAVMLIVLYTSHGISAKTTTALLGTISALVLTAGLAAWAASAAHLNGQTGEDTLTLTSLVGVRAISAAVISGLVMVGLGVLNDVTVTQASAVWELKAAAGHLPARQLLTRGMRIGRDHLASTVYTIAFAYAGLSLPILLLIDLYDRPLPQVLTSAPIAQDVIGILVSGIGLTLAIPLTTVAAALIAATAGAVPHAAHVGETSDEAFEKGWVFRRRRDPAPAETSPRPATNDQLALDASDWSSWPT